MPKHFGGRIRIDRKEAFEAINALNQEPAVTQDPRLLNLMIISTACLNEIIDLEKRLEKLERAGGE